MNDQQAKVIKALENPKYDWRTIDGIVKDTGLSKEAVIEILRTLEELVIRSSIPAKDGRLLYTTRDHYSKTQSFLTRSLTALSGSIKR